MDPIFISRCLSLEIKARVGFTCIYWLEFGTQSDEFLAFHSLSFVEFPDLEGVVSKKEGKKGFEVGIGIQEMPANSRAQIRISAGI